MITYPNSENAQLFAVTPETPNGNGNGNGKSGCKGPKTEGLTLNL